MTDAEQVVVEMLREAFPDTEVGTGAVMCPFCGHRMYDHYWFRSNYEEPDPYIECCEGDRRSFTACRCERHPSQFTAEQLAAIDADEGASTHAGEYLNSAKETVSARHADKILGVPAGTVLRYCKANQIPHEKRTGKTGAATYWLALVDVLDLKKRMRH